MTYPPVPHDPNRPPAGAPAYGPPPPGYPAPKKSRTKLILGILGGLAGLCCVGGTIAAVAGIGGSKPGAGGSTPATTAKDAGDKPAAKAVPRQPAATGDSVRDGKFEFRVTEVDCSKSEVGSEYMNKKAQGKFCQISLTVKNIGDEAQVFDGSSQKAMDAKGTEFSNDGTAELYANQDNSTFLNEINPGNQATGKVIFDVPKATTLTSLELHDSPFSGGATVALS